MLLNQADVRPNPKQWGACFIKANTVKNLCESLFSNGKQRLNQFGFESSLRTERRFQPMEIDSCEKFIEVFVAIDSSRSLKRGAFEF